jgi:hypothetical protein
MTIDEMIGQIGVGPNHDYAVTGLREKLRLLLVDGSTQMERYEARAYLTAVRDHVVIFQSGVVGSAWVYPVVNPQPTAQANSKLSAPAAILGRIKDLEATIADLRSSLNLIATAGPEVTER